MDEKNFKIPRELWKTIAFTVLAALLIMVFFTGAVIYVKALQAQMAIACDSRTSNAKPRTSTTGFTEEERWDGYDFLIVPDKALVVLRIASSSRCFITPNVTSKHGDNAKVLHVIPDELSPELVAAFASTEVPQFCSGLSIFYAQEATTSDNDRKKRQTLTALTPEPGIRAVQGPGPDPTAYDPLPIKYGPGADEAQFAGKSFLDTKYEDRQPNCRDLLLFCPDNVGQVQNCFSGDNAIYFMQRKCVAENKFEIRFTKPPGRIMKVQQQMFRACLFRRQQGLAC